MIHHNEHPTQEPAAAVVYARGIDDYRVIADAMPQIVYITRADGACDYINQRWYEYTGASPEAALGFGWSNHLHPEDYARTLVCWEQAFSSGHPFEIEYRLRNGHGEYLWHLSRAQPVYNEVQQITHWIGTATDIHSRKQTAAALEASEQRFRLAQIEALQVSEERFAKAFRASPYVLVISRQVDGGLQEVNQGWEELFGYSQAEAIGRTAVDLQLYVDLNDRERILHQIEAQGFVRDFKVNFQDRWGKIHYTNVSVEALIINSEACWLMMVQDLTERKRAEEHFQQLIEYAPNGIVMVDMVGKIQLVNTQVEQFFGYTRQELIGQPVEVLVPTAIRHAHPGYLHSFTEQPIPRPMGAGRDLFGLHKDGHTIPVEIGLNPIETMDGQMILATIVDISPRKRAEVILRQSEERLRLATEAGRIGIFDHDIRTGQTQFSPIYCEIAQFPADQPPTIEEWLARVHPEDRALVEKITKYAKAEAQSHHDEYRIMLPDQSIRWLEVSTFVAKDAQGQPVRLTGAVRDITERKQSEELLRDANKILEQRVLARTAQLEAANQELEAFTYSVSHDLRAPLRAMGSFSEILLDQLANELADKPSHYLQRIRYNAQQMGQLIDDLLAFSRLSRQPLQKQTIAPAALVEQVLTDLSLDQEQRTIDITLAALPTCQADPNLLRQVFANLLENALKYTRKRPQAKIEIGWQVQPQEDGRPPEQVYFVRDNGVGFDMRYVDKLFGVFQRLHSNEEYEGTGVGLATVQRIIHRHGGQIWAQAEVDKGASFYFSLGQGEPSDGPGNNRKG